MLFIPISKTIALNNTSPVAIQNAPNAANGTGNTKTVVKSQSSGQDSAGQTVQIVDYPNLGGKQCTQYLSITPRKN